MIEPPQVLDWIRTNLTGIGAAVGSVVGLCSLVLGILNRVDQRREAKERRRERDPTCEATVNPIVDDEGWRPLKLVFRTPRSTGFAIERLEAVQPRGMLLSTRVGSTGDRNRSQVGRTLDVVGWRVDPPKEAGKPASQTNLFCRPSDGATEIRIRIWARESSPSLRRFKIETRAMMPSAPAS